MREVEQRRVFRFGRWTYEGWCRCGMRFAGLPEPWNPDTEIGCPGCQYQDELVRMVATDDTTQSDTEQKGDV